jgi:NAD(P)-dependent dehydrogenase (short-subunit alcohol dehydrogenase family)
LGVPGRNRTSRASLPSNRAGSSPPTKVSVAAIRCCRSANAAFRENPELVKAVEAEIALGRFGEPSEIAVVAFLASDEGHWVTGQTIEASGGYKL